MKNIHLFTLIIFILCSCSSKRLIGTYTHLEEKDSRTTIERLKLKENYAFEYYVYSYNNTQKQKNGAVKNPIIIGKGKYKIKRDSIYLIFQKDHFDFTEYSKKHLSITKNPIINKLSQVKIDFGYGNYGIRIINNNNEISKSNIEGIALFEILEDKFPIDLKIDFSDSDFRIFKKYDLSLSDITSYDIYFGLPYPNKFKTDLVFPIIKNKSELRIGEMKNVF